ncbi:MAG: PqqD family protein [Synechococcus sp.]|nr:PqqD family protein [Synechococcus sp.]
MPVEIDTHLRFRHHPHVAITELDGVVSLFQGNTCDYLTLNETGSAIWQALAHQPTIDEICITMQRHYEVDPEICRREVEAWLNEALSKQLITSTQPSEVQMIKKRNVS